MRGFCVLLLCLISFSAFNQNYTIAGKVLDNDGEALPLAHILIPENDKAFVTDVNGKFSFSYPTGSLTLEIRYTGYTTLRQTFELKKDTTLLFTLQLSSEQLNEVVIKSSQILQSDQLISTRSSTLTLSEKEINAIPVLGGEADLIKTIQLLPGVSKGIEGTTDLFVRGGAADQNLVLLDGAPVYNTGHLFGFLSVFNPDILEGVESINGAFPANYGGRLSSILNVNTKSRMAEKTMVSGNIGLLASRLMIRQPILKNKLEIWVAGRRTYVDQVVKAVGETLPYFFYDVNSKIIYQANTKDRFEFTNFVGEDVLNFVRTGRDTASNFRFTSDFTIANSGQTFLWKRKIKENLNSTLRAYRTSFRYSIENQFEESRLFTNSDILDWGTNWTLTQKFTDTFSQTLGVELVQHQVSPNVITTSGEISQLLESSNTQSQKSLESAVFYQADGKFRKDWSWSTGIRLSSVAVNNTFYLNPEPRLAIRYQLKENAALKASYSRMAQYIHRVSSAAVAFPTDIWYPVTDRVVPQTADQFTLAFNQNLPKQNLFISLETYYKDLNKLIGYREGTNLFLNTSFEDQLIQGAGQAYGFEVLIKKEKGKFTGWISYTLSKSLRQYDEINQGNWFLARYDRRHNGAIVLNYELGKRFSLSGVFEFISGSRFTPIIGQYIVPSTTLGGVQLIPVYASINSVKLADTHRLDLGLKYQSLPTKKFRSEWFIGVYNSYNRATPLGINIVPNPDGSFRYEQPGLFGFLPFIRYGFQFSAMTKKVFIIFSSLISALLVLSCLPEPLPVDDIPKLETKIVVSSQIIPNTGLVVFVSKSIGALDAGDDSDPESLIDQIAISDAVVTLSVNESLDTLENLGNGLYGNIILDWQSNVDYTLTVNTTSLGSVTAVTRIPDFVSFDEVSATIFDNGFDSLAQIAYRLTDPVGENYYMINVQRFRSSQQLSRLVNPRIYTRLFDDQEFDGQEKAETFNVLFQEFSEGDSIAVSMANINKAYYDFLKVRSDNRFSFVEFAGEPINYPTNVQGGYGFFNLHAPDVRLFILE